MCSFVLKISLHIEIKPFFVPVHLFVALKLKKKKSNTEIIQNLPLNFFTTEYIITSALFFPLISDCILLAGPQTFSLNKIELKSDCMLL